MPWECNTSVIEDETESSDEKKKNPLLRYQDLYIPSNVRFVGTMNMDGTAQSLSPKVIDRCIFIEFNAPDPGEDDKNPDFCLTQTYYSSNSFAEIWDPKENLDISRAFAKISDDPKALSHGFIAGRRLLKYAKCMWPMYHHLVPDNSVTDYIDLLLCSKVLPSITSASDVKKFITDFPKAKIRFDAGTARGERLHPYDNESWSYWE